MSLHDHAIALINSIGTTICFALSATGAAVASQSSQIVHLGAHASVSAAPAPNAIVAENSKPGSPPSEWDITDCGSDSIQGYAAEISVKPGETVQFKIKTDSSDYVLDVYRMGYYGGMGARRITTLSPTAKLPQIQPDCAVDPSIGLVDCGNWDVSAEWSVPSGTISGIYFAKLIRLDKPLVEDSSHIYFIVRDDEGRSDLLFQTSDTTWQAYNSYGGASLYKDFQFALPAGRAFKVSYNRPFNTRQDIAGLGKRSFLFNAEYPMVRWLEANGFDVSYATGVDTARNAGLLAGHKVFMSVGHDEYWSQDQRANVEAARDIGVNLVFLSGNSCFWKTRWETSIDGSTEPFKTLVCYKETKADAKIDPDPSAWTGSWRDPRFSPPADGGRPENALKGTLFTVNGPRADSIQVPAADGKLRLWRGTAVASMAAGTVAETPAGTLGHEWDTDIDNGSRPPGLFRMSTTPIHLHGAYLLDYGTSYGIGEAVHSLTMYRHPSGALVFGAGTIQWSWGLDGVHDRGPSVTDPSMQQATVNLLADMGAQPMSLQSGMVRADASTDSTPPFSAISSPIDGTTVLASDSVTISGTAVDAGGGIVAGVEISIDAGLSWHPATGREEWSYVLRPGPAGVLVLAVRAIDDSGNIEIPSYPITLNRADDASSPLSIFGWNLRPIEDSHHDGKNAVGVKFRSDVDGVVTGIRYYKGGGNNGAHTGKLWTAAGALLSAATFADESYSGWQQVIFSTPVPIGADTTFVASIQSQAACAIDNDYFTWQGFDNGPLHALQSGVDGGNGVFAYLHAGFPSATTQDRNYWIDVLFEPSAPETWQRDASSPIPRK